MKLDIKAVEMLISNTFGFRPKKNIQRKGDGFRFKGQEVDSDSDSRCPDSHITDYLTRAVNSPSSDPVEAVPAGFLVGFIWPCTEICLAKVILTRTSLISVTWLF